ncbi:hypothetical protein GF371_02255 [Candidatus Woesearchaeota archaeon]|nr:hypothetical protein [Candidatus Woesearchaeota archaeon]
MAKKRKRTAKRRKKKAGFWRIVGKLIACAAKGVFYTCKGGFIAVRFFVRLGTRRAKKNAAKKLEKRMEKKIEKKRPKIDANYSALTEIKKIKGNVSKFESELLGKESVIGIIIGARGSGKSAIGMKLLENFRTKTNKNVYAMGFRKEDLPGWISVVENINQIKNDSVVLIDEGGIVFSSRKSMSTANQLLSDLLMIARHKNLSVLFITQNSSNLEVNVLRQADFLVMKPSSLLQKDFERKIIKNIYEKVADDFEEHSDDKGLTYIHSSKFQGFVSNELPSFWSQKVSKAFK